MINYTNIRRIDGVPFAEYTGGKGYSHSFLRGEINGVKQEITITDKMRLGTLVDTILTSPGDVNVYDPLFETARNIGVAILGHFGSLIEHFVPQVSYTADMEFKGFIMPVKGRLDWLLPGHADIDLKVTSIKTNKAFNDHILRMGYNNQQWNYARMAQVPNAYILPYSTTAGKCLDIVQVPVTQSNPFWEEKILKFGTYVK